MARQVVNQVENNFSGGLITEATALNFPENACTDTDNCVFHPKGDVYRRYGLDYEDSYSTKTISLSGNAMSYATWVNPSGEDKTFFVLQVGRYLYFYNVADAAVSDGAHATAIDMDGYKTSTAALLAENECQFAHGQGYLFVVHPYCKPFYVEYDAGTDALTSAGIDVKVRDTEGIVDETGYTYDERPNSLTDEHTYNLYNQGWSPTSSKDYITAWRTAVTNTVYLVVNNVVVPQVYTVSAANTNYPSNADVWWMCQGADLSFLPHLADDNKRGNTPAPKGYYIMDAWNMDRETASGISATPALTTTTSGVNRPSTIAFFAGRCFYAGCNAQDYSNKLFFTQIIKNTEQFGRCYQQNDPTNKDLFSLLATDGGFVSIPDAGRIIKLVSIQTSLLIFATNGVWVLSGNQNIGFTASDYTIRKASSIPAISANSFVDIEGLPCWWNYDGIYLVSEVNGYGGLKIDSLTQEKIRTYYKETIKVQPKLYAKGAYNQLTKEISWVFRSTDLSTVIERYSYDRALTFSMINKAFYPWSFTTSTVSIHGLTALRTRGTNRQTVSGVRTNVTSMQGSVFKFLLSTGGDTVTFGETKDSTFKDFTVATTTGVDYTSYLVTGYKLDPGQAMRKFQINYVTVYTRFLDNPQFYFRGIFNTGNAVGSGHWGTNQLVQFPEVGDFDYRSRKLKVRGSGKALQFKISSVTGKPFDISGWSKFQTANSGI